MRDRYWPESEEHPPLGAILLLMDGDIDDAAAASAIEQHCRDCWECRARREKLERGIHAFMEYRQEVLLPSVPPASPQRHLFRKRAEAVLAGLGQETWTAGWWRRVFRGMSARLALGIAPGPRLAAGITAAVSVAVVIFLMAIPVAHAPKLTAAELIQRARASAVRGLPVQAAAAGLTRKVVYQRIQIRSGNRTMEREVVLAGTGAGADTSPLDPEWAHVFDAATPIDWRNPLGVERYERWREEEGKGQDTVSEADGFATLNTVPAAATPIQSASLTVRESDWHPVAKHVDFADRTEVEVREIGYGVRELPQPENTAKVLEPPARTAAPPETAAPEAPAAVDLAEAEVSLREVLHKIGADVEEMPDIVRDGSVIRFRASAETPERRQELLAAVQGIPHVVAEISGYGGASVAINETGTQQATDAQTYSTSPPLIKSLQDYLGGLDTANNYLHGVRDSYRQVLLDSSALQRLGDRYTDAEWNRLTPELRGRINRLAADYIDAVRRDSGTYLKQVSMGLDEMLTRSRLTAETAGEADTGCRSWRTDSAGLVDDARNLETTFQRLFVVEKTDTPVQYSADALLFQSARLRARFGQEIGRFCSPEGAK